MNPQEKPMLSHRMSLLLLVGLNLAFMVATWFPLGHLVLTPLNTLVTTLHELGHATACIATGGSVDGLTIVSDGAGHGGLTWCHGGWPFVWTQTGYLGAALFGCILLRLGSRPERARNVLSTMGIVVGLASFAFMGWGLLQGKNIMQELGSMAWGLGLAAALYFVGRKLSVRIAHLLLLVLAGQIALNALTDIWFLFQLSSGVIASDAYSDATLMAQRGYGPATMWSVIWGCASFAMVWFTLRRWHLTSVRTNDNT